MYRALTAAVAATVVGSALVTGAAPNASARTELPSRAVLQDGTGDVWIGSMDVGGEPTRVNRPTADVIRAVATHRTGRVVVRMDFSNLRRVGEAQDYAAKIRTPNGSYSAEVQVDPSLPSGWQGRHLFHKGNRDVSCARLTHTVDYTADVVTMRVPRSCLGEPRWVKLNLSNWLWGSGQALPFMDNPHNHRIHSDAFTIRLYRH